MVLPKLKEGMREIEVAAELEYHMRRRGAQRVAFDTIVASGPRSALPHGVASERRISEGDLVVIDFGVVLGGYCSDLTRTICVGEPTAKQEDIYNLVLEAQEKALASLRAGKKVAEIDGVAREIIAQKGYGDAFGHGLGHGVGIMVHEEPSLSPRNQSTFLEEGMVVTVEPGIYLEGWGGVRIEDMAVVTEEGCRVLTTSPKELFKI